MKKFKNKHDSFNLQFFVFYEDLTYLVLYILNRFIILVQLGDNQKTTGDYLSEVIAEKISQSFSHLHKRPTFPRLETAFFNNNNYLKFTS